MLIWVRGAQIQEYLHERRSNAYQTATYDCFSFRSSSTLFFLAFSFSTLLSRPGDKLGISLEYFNPLLTFLKVHFSLTFYPHIVHNGIRCG